MEARRASAVVAAVAVVLAAAGLGWHVHTTPELCRSTSALDRLDVRRTDPFPGNGLRYTLPEEVGTTEPAAVRAVAEALCALPATDGGTSACASDTGVEQHLTFSTGSREFEEVVLHVSGCPSVTGVGDRRRLLPAVWRPLALAVHARGTVSDAFTGTWPRSRP